jgi:hypothetical protein
MDRIAWTSFVCGTIGMILMAFVAATSDDEGGFRSCEKIRLHRTLFLTTAGLAVSVPTAVWLLQVTRQPSAPAPKWRIGED